MRDAVSEKLNKTGDTGLGYGISASTIREAEREVRGIVGIERTAVGAKVTWYKEPGQHGYVNARAPILEYGAVRREASKNTK